MKRNPAKASAPKTHDELRPEYDLQELLKGGFTGKYSSRFQQAKNIVRIDPEVLSVLPTSEAVNEANQFNGVGTNKRKSIR